MGAVGSKVGAGALIVLMVVCSLMLWIGIPLGWLWIGSMVVNTTQPSMGPYMLVAGGIVASVIVDALIISRLNQAYQRVTNSEGKVRIPLPWLRSMRGERSPGRPTSVLDVIMVGTVVLAATAAAIWFFAFAGSSLPGS